MCFHNWRMSNMALFTESVYISSLGCRYHSEQTTTLLHRKNCHTSPSGLDAIFLSACLPHVVAIFYTGHELSSVLSPSTLVPKHKSKRLSSPLRYCWPELHQRWYKNPLYWQKCMFTTGRTHYRSFSCAKCFWPKAKDDLSYDTILLRLLLGVWQEAV